MKKGICLIAVILILLGITACDEEEKNTSPTSVTHQSTSTEQKATTTDEKQTSTSSDETTTTVSFGTMTHTTTTATTVSTQTPTTSVVSTTKPSATTTKKIPVTTTTQHRHVFSTVTCTEDSRCVCGAINEAAKGHTFVKGVCAACGSTDPDYKPIGEYLWKYGSEEEYVEFFGGYAVNVESLDFSGRSITYVSACRGTETSELSEETINSLVHDEDCQNLLFGRRMYEFVSSDGLLIDSVQESDTQITIQTNKGTMMLNRDSAKQMTVVSNTITHYWEMLKPGDVLTAHPRWGFELCYW